MKQVISIESKLDFIESFFNCMNDCQQLVTAIYPKSLINLDSLEDQKSILESYNVTTVAETYKSVFAPLYKKISTLVDYYDSHLKNIKEEIHSSELGALKIKDSYVLLYDYYTFQKIGLSTDSVPNYLPASEAIEIPHQKFYAYCKTIQSFLKGLLFKEKRGRKSASNIVNGKTVEDLWVKSQKKTFKDLVEFLLNPPNMDGHREYDDPKVVTPFIELNGNEISWIRSNKEGYTLMIFLERYKFIELAWKELDPNKIPGKSKADIFKQTFKHEVDYRSFRGDFSKDILNLFKKFK